MRVPADRPRAGPPRPGPPRALAGPDPVAVRAGREPLPAAARQADRDRRQPVAVVDDLHGQGARPRQGGDPEHQRPGQRRVQGRWGGLAATMPVLGSAIRAKAARLRSGRCPPRSRRLLLDDSARTVPRQPVRIQVAAAGPARRVAAQWLASVPAPTGRERAQPAAARGLAGIVERGMALDHGPGQGGTGSQGAGPGVPRRRPTPVRLAPGVGCSVPALAPPAATPSPHAGEPGSCCRSP